MATNDELAEARRKMDEKRDREAVLCEKHSTYYYPQAEGSFCAGCRLEEEDSGA